MTRLIPIGLLVGVLAVGAVALFIADDGPDPGCADFRAAEWKAGEDRDFQADALENCPSLLVGKSRVAAYRLLGEKHSTWNAAQLRLVKHDTWHVSSGDDGGRTLTLEYEEAHVSRLSVYTQSPDPLGFD